MKASDLLQSRQYEVIRWDLVCKPSGQEFRVMLQEIIDHCGRRATGRLLGVSLLTMSTWLAGEHQPTAAGGRLVWMVHSLLFYPAKLGTAFNLMTWGKFIDPDKLKPPLDDWSI